MKRYLLIGLAGFATACAASTDHGSPPEDVGNESESIINGSTDFTGLEFQQQRTVRIRTPGNEVCSGTLLLPNVVMTARHCTTTDGTIGGTLAAPSEIRARVLAKPVGPVAPPGVDPCAGAGRDPSCAEASTIVQRDAAFDMVFLRLAAPIQFNGNVTMFTPVELSDDNAQYLNKALVQSGWGRNTCDPHAGTLRWAKEKVVSVTGPRIELEPIANKGIWKGDSGGPTWGTTTFPAASLAVTSTGNCGTDDAGNAVAKNSHHVQIATNFTDVRNMFKTAAAFKDVSDPLDDLGELHIVDLDSTDTKPDWKISGGHLTTPTESGPNIVIVGDTLVQRALGGVISTTFKTFDDDNTGVVFSYVDHTHYMRCELNDSDEVLSLVLVRGGTKTVLASAPWTGDFQFATTVTADLTPTFPSSGATFPIRCTVTGGNHSTVSITGFSDVLPAGRVGIYNDMLDDVTYTSFKVNQP